MKRVFLLILFIFINFKAFSQDVNVDLDPKIPTAGERFDLIFQLKMKGNQPPKISFRHDGLELLGKRSGGVSLNTTIINGQISTSKEMTLAYTLMAKTPGIFSVSDIIVEIDGKRLNYAPFEIEVLKERKEASGYFLIAIPSKTKIYLGEGIDINYYIYHQPSLRVTGEAVEDFPKFEKFIKRFHNIQPTIEQVNYNGAVFYRRLLYSARLFPEKTGELTIDPLRVTFQYYDTQKSFDSFGGFGAFGFTSRNTEQKTLSSKPVTISVRSVPNPPGDFSGLIGNHEFKLEMVREKVLVNEPIELKFIVEGPGALENFAGPKLYQNPNLEEFDSKSEITELSLNRAKKTFDYTYLPKGPFQKPSEEITFSVFDPQTERYISKKIVLPELIVGGSAIKSFSSGNQSGDKKEMVTSLESSDDKILAPYFMESAPISKSSWINYLLSFLIFLVGAEFAYQRFSKDGKYRHYLDLCGTLKKRGPDYSILHKLLIPLDKDSMEASLIEVINNSELSADGKEYFKKLVELSEKKSYGNQSIKEGFDYRDNFFKELLGFLQKT